MSVYWLRFEITNLTNTIFDVHDISSIRGSSYVALNAPEQLSIHLQQMPEITTVEQRFDGGSQGIYRIHTDQSVAELESNIARWWQQTKVFKIFPLKYLQYTLAVLPWPDNADEQQLLTYSEAICKWQPFKLPSVILPDEKNDHSQIAESTHPYCDVDRVRPVYKAWDYYHDPGVGESFSMPGDGPRETKYLSQYVYHRRQYGRGLRPKTLYEKELGDQHQTLLTRFDDLFFTDAFEEIVAKPPSNGAMALPVSLTNKMAVVFFDVNGLGKTRREIKDTQALDKLSRALREQRQKILAEVLEKLSPVAHQERWIYNKQKIRFETLLWGSDEASCVMPSWLAWDFLAAFFQHAAIILPTPAGPVTKTHSAGMVICDRKMPIRKIRQLANELREQAKQGIGDINSVQIEILESIDIPSQHLQRQRTHLFGESATAELFTLSGENWSRLTQQITHLKNSFPRSQLNQLLAQVCSIEKNQDFVANAAKKSEQALTALLDKQQYSSGKDKIIELGDFTDTPLSGANHNLLMTLYHLERFWDYVEPFNLATGGDA